MAVGFSAVSESHTSTTGSTSQASFSWTHSQTGVPGGVLVFVCTNANAQDATSVTYGTDTVPAVSGGATTDSTGEPRSVQTFFLGSTALSGNQTVTVNRNNNANVMYAVCFTVTSVGSTEVTGVVTENADGTLAEVNVDDGSLSGTNSLRFAFVNSAINSVPAAGANTTVGTGYSIDFGTNVARAGRETTAGIGSRPVGFSDGNTDDKAAIYLAVREASRTKSPAVGAEVYAGGTPTLSLTGHVMFYPGVGAEVYAGGTPTAQTPRTVRVTWVRLVIPSSGTVNTNYSPAVGAEVYAGLAPTVRRDVICYPGVGAVVAAGLTPVLIRGSIFAPAVGTEVYAGGTPSTITDARITPAIGSAVYAGGAAPYTIIDTRIAPAVGSAVVQGTSAPIVQRADSVFPGAGSVLAQGLTPTVSGTNDYNISVGIGALVATGFAPSADRTAHQVAAPPIGVEVYAGLTPAVSQTADQYAAPALGSVAFSGLAPTLQVTQHVIATVAVGSVAFGGFAPTSSLSSARYVRVTWVRLVLPAAPPAITTAPAVGSAVYAGLAPTVQVTANVVSAPALGSMAFAGLAPTVSRSDNIVCSPAVGMVVAAGLAPTMQQTHDVTTAPAVGSAVYSGLTPLLSTSDNRFAQPTVGSAVYVGLAPSASISGNVICSPAAGSAVYAGRAPNVGGRTVRVTWVRLVAPYAVADHVVNPAVGSVAYAGRAPSIGTSGSVFPGVGSEVYAGLAPLEGHYGIDISWDDVGADEGYRVKWGTASGVYTDSMDVGTDVLTAFISGLVYGQTYYFVIYALVGGVEQTASDEIVLTIGFGPTPAIGSLIYAGLAPTIQVGGSVQVAPAVGAEVYAGRAPTVQTTGNITHAPGVGAEAYVGLAPSVQVGNNIICSPAVGSAAYAGGTPTYLVGDHRLAYPAVGTETYAGLTPTVQATGHVACSPAVGSAVYAGLVPTIAVGNNVVCAPTVGAVAYAGRVPSYLIGDHRLFYPTIGAEVYAGLVPTATRTQNVVCAPAVGTLACAGLAPVTVHSTLRLPGVGSAIYAGAGPSLRLDRWPQPGAGAVVFSGLAPTRTATEHHVIAVAAGSAVYTGLPPSKSESGRIFPGLGALVFEGGAVVAPQGETAWPAAATVQWDGLLPTVEQTGNAEFRPPAGTLVVAELLPAAVITVVPVIPATSRPLAGTGLDQRLRPRARTLVDRYGKSVLLRSLLTGDNYSPVNGSASVNYVNYEVVGTVSAPARLMFDATLAKQGETALLLADDGLPIKPKPGDLVDFRDGKNAWTVLAVQSIFSGQLAAVHVLLLRRAGASTARPRATTPTALDGRLRPRAAALLGKYGKDVVLQTAVTAGDYDPEAGALRTSYINRAAKGVLQTPSKVLFDLSLAREGDTMLLLADDGLGVEPKAGDTVDFKDGDAPWTAVAVHTTYSGEQAAVHSLLLRR